MLGATLARIAGALVGLYVRWVLGDRGYGVVADALLGVTGAIAANFAAGRGEMDWSARATATIWASAALPFTAHLIARRVASHSRAQVRRQRVLELNTVKSTLVGDQETSYRGGQHGRSVRTTEAKISARVGHDSERWCPTAKLEPRWQPALKRVAWNWQRKRRRSKIN